MIGHWNGHFQVLQEGHPATVQQLFAVVFREITDVGEIRRGDQNVAGKEIAEHLELLNRSRPAIFLRGQTADETIGEIDRVRRLIGCALTLVFLALSSLILIFEAL